MILKPLLLAVILAFIVSACNLDSSDNNGLSDTPAPTRTLPFATDTNITPEASVPDTTSDSTTLPTASASGETPPVGILCVPQRDWATYTVKRGDNLTNIANRTRSTVDELIAANCLDNPNRIRVGDTIYVPNELE
jgi:LysM repeat protein